MYTIHSISPPSTSLMVHIYRSGLRGRNRSPVITHNTFIRTKHINARVLASRLSPCWCQTICEVWCPARTTTPIRGCAEKGHASMRFGLFGSFGRCATLAVVWWWWSMPPHTAPHRPGYMLRASSHTRMRRLWLILMLLLLLLFLLSRYIEDHHEQRWGQDIASNAPSLWPSIYIHFRCRWRCRNNVVVVVVDRETNGEEHSPDCLYVNICLYTNLYIYICLFGPARRKCPDAYIQSKRVRKSIAVIVTSVGQRLSLRINVYMAAAHIVLRMAGVIWCIYWLTGFVYIEDKVRTYLTTIMMLYS